MPFSTGIAYTMLSLNSNEILVSVCDQSKPEKDETEPIHTTNYISSDENLQHPSILFCPQYGNHLIKTFVHILTVRISIIEHIVNTLWEKNLTNCHYFVP
jgi:hypothetical protein